MHNTIFIIQIICMLSILGLVMIQNRGASLSSSFGGKDQVYLTRRGIEKSVVYMTALFAIIYMVVTIANMFIKY